MRAYSGFAGQLPPRRSRPGAPACITALAAITAAEQIRSGQASAARRNTQEGVVKMRKPGARSTRQAGSGLRVRLPSSDDERPERVHLAGVAGVAELAEPEALFEGETSPCRC